MVMFHCLPARRHVGGVLSFAAWPPAILERYQEHLLPEDKSKFAFDAGSVTETAFREEVKSLGLSIFEMRYPLATKSSVHEFPFYGMTFAAPAYQMHAPFGGPSIFEKESPCSITPSWTPETPWRCGRGSKQQLKKFLLLRHLAVPRKDIAPLQTDVLLPYGKFLVVRRTVRDALVKEKLTGFRLLPILDGSKTWTEEDRSVHSSSAAQEESAEWFQLTITSLAKPFPIEEIEDDVRCKNCGVSNGDEVPGVRYREWPTELLEPVDLQYLQTFELPGGELVAGADGIPVASSRFIETRGTRGI